MTHVARLSNAAAAADVERRARVERRLGASPFLAVPLRRLGYDSRELWAWDNYQASVLGFVDHCRMTGRHEGGLVRVLEIGGGRGPLMTPREAADARIAYAVNDVDARDSPWARRNSRKFSSTSSASPTQRSPGASTSSSRAW